MILKQFSVDITSIITNGLVGYWKMNDNNATTIVKDYSGQGNDGTFNDATGDPNTSAHHTSGHGNIPSDGALEFDGVDDYVDAGNSQSLNPEYNNFSLSMWVKVYLTSGCQGVITKDCKSAYGIYYTQPSNQLGLYIQSGSNANRININSYYNQWIHVLWTVDNDNNIQKSYINGIFNVQTNYAVGNITSIFPLNFGRYTSSGTGYFNGSLDEVMIFNRLLSEDEISTLYDANKYRFSTIKRSKNNFNFTTNKNNIIIKEA